MTIDGMRKLLATEAAPSVSPLAPRRIRSSPPISSNIFIISPFCGKDSDSLR